MFAAEQIQKAQQDLGINMSSSNVPKDQLPETKEDLELHMQLSYKQSVEIAEEEAISTTLANNKWELTKRRLNEDLVVCANVPKDQLPETKEDLELHMQLSYKQSVEIAEEEAISTTLANNKWELTKRRLNEDLVVCGIAAAKTNFNKANGITLDYVDPAYLIYSYTEDPNFEDIYYVGEVKSITIPELKKQFPDISEDELQRIQEMPGNKQYITGGGVIMIIILYRFYTLNIRLILIKFLNLKELTKD